MSGETYQSVATWGAGSAWSLWRSTGESAPTTTPAEALAGRYQLGEWLGGGGNGQVWRAVDSLTGDDVAVKLVSALSAAELRQVRRETVALRWARLPGVVGLRDDGQVGDDWFIVMDLVDGVPFPGRKGVLTWDELAPVALRLLQVLAGLHAAGVVHRDLKPPNVAVVAERGDVVLLDLGLATGRAVAARERKGTFAGTPAYAAPEQLTGGELGPPTDLYAVGVMLFGALTGTVPHYDAQPMRLLGRRLREPAPPVRSLADVPESVAVVIDAMLATRPEDRPASAWEALQALGGAAPAPITGELELPVERSSRDDLRALFHGPDHFLHLREDAADVLWARTGGHPDAVRAELGAWLRAGLGHWDDGAVRLDRQIIARLQSGEGLVESEDADDDVLAVLGLVFPHGTAARVGAVLGRDVSDEVATLISQGRAWPLGDSIGTRPRRRVAGLDGPAVLKRVAEQLPRYDRGRVELLGRAGATAAQLRMTLAPVLAAPDLSPEQALALIELAVAAARAEAAPRVEAGLLHEWAAFALMLEAPAPVERALYEVQRFDGDAASLANVEALLRAARAAYRGSQDQARSQIRAVVPLRHEELEIWRCALLVHAARGDGHDAVEAELSRLEAWAEGSTEREARRLGWMGNLRYRQGRFQEAAELHEQAAAGKERVVGWVTSSRNAAAAWMDAGEFERAERLSGDVIAHAGRARMARTEASATWCRRACRVRLQASLDVLPALVMAGLQVDRQIGGQLALGEAILALKRGQAAPASRLACLAQQSFIPTSRSGGCALAVLVEMLAAPPVDTEAAIFRLEQSVAGVRAPGIRIQVLGLGGQLLDCAAMVAQARDILEDMRHIHRPLELASPVQCVDSSPYSS